MPWRCAVDREARLDQRRQLLRDVAVHAVVARPGLLGGVHIEAGAAAEVVGVVLARAAAPRGLVSGRDDDQPVLGGMALHARLLGEVRPVQVRPDSQYSTGTLPRSACGGRKTANSIGAARGARIVAVDALHAAEAAVLLERGQGHDGLIAG